MIDPTEIEQCPICLRSYKATPSKICEVLLFDCNACGPYQVSREFWDDYLGRSKDTFERDRNLAACLGHALRRRSGLGESPVIDQALVERVKKERWLPDPHEQVDNLIRLVGDYGQGRLIRIDQNDMYIVGCEDKQALFWTRDALVELGLADIRPKEGIRLNIQGFERYHDIKRGISHGRTGFLAMQFDKGLDDFVKAMRGAAEVAGFVLRRADDSRKPGIIDILMREQIKQARFVVVDLTFCNPGAHWEGGYAEGLGKPVFYTCRDDETGIHFDTAHLRRIIWKSGELEQAASELTASIRDHFGDAARASDRMGGASEIRIAPMHR